MKRFNRIVMVVLDSVGTGAAVDAKKDENQRAEPLGRGFQQFQGRLQLPTLTDLGLANISRDAPLSGMSMAHPLTSYVGRIQPAADYCDSLTAYWEMMGLSIQRPLQTFPTGLAAKFVKQIEKFTNRKVILNGRSSIGDAINDYGLQQTQEGDIIVLTSSDSILQVSANQAVVSRNELYRICRFIRFVADKNNLRLGRIIARPFAGEAPSNFILAGGRRDYAMIPPGNTVLDLLTGSDVPVIGIGKVDDIFANHGIDKSISLLNNDDRLTRLITVMEEQAFGLIMTDLGDFEASNGDRLGSQGYKEKLMRVDRQLGEIINQLKPTDLLIITADHGNDQTSNRTRHTREFVPLIAASPNAHGGQLGTRRTFSDIGATILENFGIPSQFPGTSFLNQIS